MGDYLNIGLIYSEFEVYTWLKEIHLTNMSL